MIKGWFIAVAQGNRISGYNIMESYINERLEKGEYDLGGLGSGVGNALRAILPESWGRRSAEIAFPDPFALSLDEAWQAEGIALNCAEEAKKMGLEGRLVGGQLVASVFGLRALANAKSNSVANRARAAYPSKFDLAKRSFQAYSKEAEEMLRSL